MGARNLLNDLLRAGVSLTARGDRLVVKPASLVTAARRVEIERSKPELLALLNSSLSVTPAAIERLPRPHALSAADADQAHDFPWDEAAIARCVGRITLFMRRGLHATDADDLAEQRHFRDITFDDRISCIECVSYKAGNTRACGNVQVAGVRECNSITATILQRCGGFQGVPLSANLEEPKPGIGG